MLIYYYQLRRFVFELCSIESQPTERERERERGWRYPRHTHALAHCRWLATEQQYKSYTATCFSTNSACRNATTFQLPLSLSVYVYVCVCVCEKLHEWQDAPWSVCLRSRTLAASALTVSASWLKNTQPHVELQLYTWYTKLHVLVPTSPARKILATTAVQPTFNPFVTVAYPPAVLA